MLVGFKHKLQDNDDFGELIELATGSPWTHAELIFPELGLSASSWAHTNGVAIKPTAVNSLYWEIYGLGHVSPGPVLEFIGRQIGSGAGYDWQGIFFTHVLPYGKQDFNAWTCSELVYYCLAHYTPFGFPTSPHVMPSPGQLRDMLIAAGFRQVPVNYT